MFKQPPSGALWGTGFRKVYAPDVSATGKGQVIGIFADDGIFLADMDAYEAAAGVTRPPLQIVLTGTATGGQSSDNCEVSMDVENAMSMAPGIKQITIYEADGSHASTLAQLAEMAKPTKGEPLPGQISTSVSFYYDANIYAALNRFSAQGQAFFTASGDFGAYTSNQAFARNTPFPPQDYPWITSVGGTVLTVDSDGAWSSETGWYKSGGGYSPWQCGDSTFDIPDYQTYKSSISNSSNRASPIARNVPDVAMPASNIAALSENGVWSLVSGTSSSAPLWAGFSALVNEVSVARKVGQLGFLNPAIYAVGRSPGYEKAFHDITSGSNSNTVDPNQFAAVSGYDLVTGWGTPQGQATIDALIAVSVPQIDCAQVSSVESALQTQLLDALKAFHSAACAGPASHLCSETINAIKGEIQIEVAAYDKYCRTASLSPSLWQKQIAATTPTILRKSRIVAARCAYSSDYQ